MQDRGTLAASAASRRQIVDGGQAIEIITPQGRKALRQNKLRPFSFFIESDATLYLSWASEELLQPQK